MGAERRIAVDARPLCHPGTGIYRYTYELLSRMCRLGGEWYLYSSQHYEAPELQLSNVHHRMARVPASLRAGQLAHGLFPLWVRQDHVHGFWGPRHQLPLMLPPDVNAVVTIHDLVFRDCGGTMRFPGRQIETIFTPRAIARADRIAVVSEFTRQRLRHHYPQHAHKVSVVSGASMLQAASGDVDQKASLVGRDYFLFVGTLEPRKNLTRLLRAFRRYCDNVPQALPLKIVGGSGWGGDDINGLLKQLKLSGCVELLGKVDEPDLRALYRGAFALVMPSLYEGFGLPVVEALSMGVPVLTSRESAMAEVAGQAGLYIDPFSEQDIRDALEQLTVDAALYSRLRARTAVEIQRYDWDDSAKAMAGLLLS